MGLGFRVWAQGSIFQLLRSGMAQAYATSLQSGSCMLVTLYTSRKVLSKHIVNRLEQEPPCRQLLSKTIASKINNGSRRFAASGSDGLDPLSEPHGPRGDQPESVPSGFLVGVIQGPYNNCQYYFGGSLL